MTSKPHLAIHYVPDIHDGDDISVLCEEVLKSVLIAQWSDVAILGQDWKLIFNSLSVCTNCLRVAETLSTEKPEWVRYIYALVSRDSKLGQKLENSALEESA